MTEHTEQLTVPPLLVRDVEAARLLGVSPSHFSQHLSTSATFGPRPYRIGATSRVKLWRVSDLRAWVRLGLPSRDEWLRLMLEDKNSTDCPHEAHGCDCDRQTVGEGAK
ncbi:MAG TPA: hypothetical protein PLF11_08700 [Bacillota bacterium]|jgi:predicted DNA-binding transcriptional regulator AlpA|nr:hypothetical protein [Verrucomicrobiota bacterium]HOI37447.1 hypothetical protein [Bacillota bacterium]